MPVTRHPAVRSHKLFYLEQDLEQSLAQARALTNWSYAQAPEKAPELLWARSLEVAFTDFAQQLPINLYSHGITEQYRKPVEHHRTQVAVEVNRRQDTHPLWQQEPPYRVKKGDTLESIARKHSLSLEQLYAYNPGLKEEDPKRLAIGRWLSLSPPVVETLEAKLEIKVPLHPKEAQEVAYALGFLGRPVSEWPMLEPGPASGPLPWSGPKGVNPRWGYDWTRSDQSWQGQQAKYEQERAIVDELFAWTMQAVEAQKAPSVYELQYQSAMEGLIRLEYFSSGLANGLTSNQVPGGLNRDYGRPFGEGVTVKDYESGQHVGDCISYALGVVEVIQGGINAAGGLLLAPETLGASAALSLAGAAMITHGLSTISNATRHLTEPETKRYQESHSQAKTKKPSVTDEHGRVQAKSSKGGSGKSNAAKRTDSTILKKSSLGEDWDILDTNLKFDQGAHDLADEIGGVAQVRFRNSNREFDAISDKYIGQHKPALGDNFGRTFKTQARATFEAAKATGREVYYRFDGQPGEEVIKKLNQYSGEYKVPVHIKY